MSIARSGEIGAALYARCLLKLGYPAPRPTAARAVLEQEILKALARDPAIAALLFVGCNWYTAHYERLLSGTTVHTMDPDPHRQRFGAARHHVAALQDLEARFAGESFDAIVCDGIDEAALATADAREQVFRACANSLRPGGWLILGWNPTALRDPTPPFELELEGFTAEPFASFGTARFEVASCTEPHTYAFYRRRLQLGPTPSSPATDSRTAPTDGARPLDQR